MGDEVQLSMNDPLREKSNEAAGQSDCNTKRNGNPAPDLLPLPHQIFRPVLILSYRGLFVSMPHLKSAGNKNNTLSTYHMTECKHACHTGSLDSALIVVGACYPVLRSRDRK